jgi:MoxR-like ATPase
MPDDVKSMAEDVLAHRIIIKGSSIYSKSLSAADLINGILGSVSVPTENTIAVED